MLIVETEMAEKISADFKNLKQELKKEDINAPFIVILAPIDEVIENGLMDDNCKL
jgi:hypothetical protein